MCSLTSLHVYSPLTLTSSHQTFLAALASSSPPPPPSPSSQFAAGARPRLTFVISNPAGSVYKKRSAVNSLSDLIPLLLFLMALALLSSFFSPPHYLLFRLLRRRLNFSDCHKAFLFLSSHSYIWEAAVGLWGRQGGGGGRGGSFLPSFLVPMILNSPLSLSLLPLWLLPRPLLLHSLYHLHSFSGN